MKVHNVERGLKGLKETGTEKGSGMHTSSVIENAKGNIERGIDMSPMVDLRKCKEVVLCYLSRRGHLVDLVDHLLDQGRFQERCILRPDLLNPIGDVDAELWNLSLNLLEQVRWLGSL